MDSSQVRAVRNYFADSQGEFGDVLGVSEKRVGELENGHEPTKWELLELRFLERTMHAESDGIIELEDSLSPERIRNIRKKLGLNKQEMAELAETEEQTIQAWESGEEELPQKYLLFFQALEARREIGIDIGISSEEQVERLGNLFERLAAGVIGAGLVAVGVGLLYMAVMGPEPVDKLFFLMAGSVLCLLGGILMLSYAVLSECSLQAKIGGKDFGIKFNNHARGFQAA